MKRQWLAKHREGGPRFPQTLLVPSRLSFWNRWGIRQAVGGYAAEGTIADHYYTMWSGAFTGLGKRALPAQHRSQWGNGRTSLTRSEATVSRLRGAEPMPRVE